MSRFPLRTPSPSSSTSPRPSLPRRLVGSLLRIAVLTALVGGTCLGGFAALLTQPVWGTFDVELETRASPERLERDVRWLARSKPARNSDHPEVLHAVSRSLARSFRSSGGRVRFQAYEARGAWYRNVVASYGPEEGPRLVIGAHYDVFGALPGADDNASGVAGLLELGRLLGTADPALRVDLVAFTLEEPPYFASDLMGSARFARSLKRNRVRVEGMICLEMIGYSSLKQPHSSWIWKLIYPDRGDFIAVIGRWADRRLARHVKKGIRTAGRVEAWSLSAPRMAGMDASDHRSFWDQGYPAVMVTDTAYVRNPNYHTIHDTPETLDYEMLAGVVDGVLAGILAHPPPGGALEAHPSGAGGTGSGPTVGRAAGDPTVDGPRHTGDCTPQGGPADGPGRGQDGWSEACPSLWPRLERRTRKCDSGEAGARVPRAPAEP